MKSINCGTFGHNFNDRDQHFSNISGNYENNYDNKGHNSNNGYNNRQNVVHAGEAHSRKQYFTAGKLCPTFVVTRGKECGIKNSLVRSVENVLNTCKIGYKRSNLPQAVHVSQDRKLYYYRTNLKKT